MGNDNFFSDELLSLSHCLDIEMNFDVPRCGVSGLRLVCSLENYVLKVPMALLFLMNMYTFDV